MSIYVLRLRDGNCIFVSAETEDRARQAAKTLAGDEIVSIRMMDSFAVQFSLTDEGDLQGTLLDNKTLSELYRHEYPMLSAARAQSYAEFATSDTDDASREVLFDPAASRHAKNWDTHDKDIVQFAVEQERMRFSH
jgi:hypothetical protein